MRINFFQSSVSGFLTRVVRKDTANNISGRALFATNNDLATIEWNVFALLYESFSTSPSRILNKLLVAGVDTSLSF
jgi:hypothetical protein